MHNPAQTFVMDVGANTIKAGFATDKSPHIIPNCKMKVKSERQRQYIGDQIEDCKDCSGLYYLMSHQRGFIMNWDIEREVWDYIFKSKFKNLKPKESSLIITEPYFNFKTIQNNIDEILFEEFGFDSIFRTNAGYLSSIHHQYTSDQNKIDAHSVESRQPLACLVVDSGFSFSHVVPYIYCEKKGFQKYKEGIRRIDVGGKLLTNHLKEVISYRQINVMDETYVISQCKEDVCFVSDDFDNQLQDCEKNKRNKIALDYILPDYTNVKRGYVRKPDWRDPTKSLDPSEPQFVRLANERFQVPELLFHPSDVGINQVGLVEAIVDSINSAPKKARPMLYANIVLTGGNVNIPGFKKRIESDVRMNCPSNFASIIHKPANPITYSWTGGKLLETQYQDTLKSQFITKAEYDEFGENKRKASIDKFDT